MIRRPNLTGLRAAGTLLLLFLPVAGCSKSHESTAARTAQEPQAVRLLAVGSAGAQGAWLELPGRSRAREEVTLTATTTARLSALPYAEGAAFRAGAGLARFEAPEARRALAAARARATAATLRRETAVRQHGRMDSLFAAGVVARRDLELAETDRRAAEAAEEEARSALADLGSGLALTAPFDGVVVRHHVDVGSALSPGQPVLDVRSRAGGEIEVAFPESAVPRLEGAAIEVRVGDGPWRAARQVRLDGMLDPVTRTRTAWLRVASGGDPEPGAYVRVRVGLAGGGAVMVPDSALVRRGALTGVFVERDGRAALRWIRLGEREGAVWQVNAGLFTGERVVLDPRGLAHGRAIRAAS